MKAQGERAAWASAETGPPPQGRRPGRAARASRSAPGARDQAASAGRGPVRRAAARGEARLRRAQRRQAHRPGAIRATRRTAREPRRLEAGARSPRPPRAPRGAGREPLARARADPLRTHAGVAVHLLPRRGPGHGGRPLDDAQLRPHRAALRRCPCPELRGLRLTRTADDLRRQRFRRDAARTVGVGPEASRRQPRDRRPRPGVHPGTVATWSRRPSASTAMSCARPPSCPRSRSGTRTCWNAANTQSEIMDILPVGSANAAFSLYLHGQADIVWDTDSCRQSCWTCCSSGRIFTHSFISTPILSVSMSPENRLMIRGSARRWRWRGQGTPCQKNHPRRRKPRVPSRPGRHGELYSARRLGLRSGAGAKTSGRGRLSRRRQDFRALNTCSTRRPAAVPEDA